MTLPAAPTAQRVVLEGNLADAYSTSRRAVADLRDASRVLPPGVVATRRADGTIRRAESIASSIYCAGDSLTLGNQDGTGTTYPGVLATATGFTVVNGGVSGQSSSDIALRQGGLVPLITVAGNSIPGTGTIACTVKPTTSWRVGNAFSFAGYIIDSSGNPQPVTLAHSGSSVAPDGGWTVGRTSGSGAITITPEAVFYLDSADAYLDHTLIAWPGRNNSSPNSYLDAVRDTLAMIAHLKPVRPRYLVLSILTATTETTGTGGHDLIVAANERLATTFGDRYVDGRGYLIASGLAAAGITPTAQDLIDIAGDTVPTSLHASADTLHLNAAGYTVVANYLKAVLIAKGWAQGSVLFQSTFTGAAAAAPTFDVSTPGLAWSVTDANWKLDGAGNLYNSAPGSTSYIVADAGRADCVVRYVMAGTFNINGGGALRYLDGSNNLAWTWEGSSGLALRLAKRVANVSTVLTPDTGTLVNGVWTAGDVIEWTLNGSTLSATKNGVVIGSWTDSTFATLTRFGAFIRSTGSTIRYSEIKVSALP